MRDDARRCNVGWPEAAAAAKLPDTSSGAAFEKAKRFWYGPSVSLRALVGRRLERGVGGSSILRIAASAWGTVSSRSVARPARLPEDVRVIGIGSAVLGGAGKTPLAIALARALTHAFAAGGERVAL